MKRDYLGTFTVTSGALRVSDPCYDRGFGCQGLIKDAALGRWHAFVDKDTVSGWGERVFTLLCMADGHDPDQGGWEQVAFSVGVDSGQAGVFDDAKYLDDAAVTGSDFGPYEFDDGFQGACGSHTISDRGAGVLSFGAVSSSGFGDGGYQTLVLRKGGKVVGVQIRFITDEDLE